MADSFDDDEHDDDSSDKPKGKQRSPNFMRGLREYGSEFSGFTTVKDTVSLLPHFKKFYYLKREEQPEMTTTLIVLAFNKQIAPAQFFPNFQRLKAWTTTWDDDITERKRKADLALSEPNQDAHLVPEDSELEMGVRTLGGELIADALGMLKSDKMNDEGLDEGERMRRRSHILNVFGFATRMTQGNAALALKKSEDKRATASFLMDLLKGASSGSMSLETIQDLKKVYTPEESPVLEHGELTPVS